MKAGRRLDSGAEVSLSYFLDIRAVLGKRSHNNAFSRKTPRDQRLVAQGAQETKVSLNY